MIKLKKLFIGGGLTIVACVMWLISACTQSGGNSVPSQPPKVTNSGTTNVTTTTEPPTLSNSTTIITSPTIVPSPTIIPSLTTTQPPVVTNSTPSGIPTTTPSQVVSTPTPSEGQTTPADINSYLLCISGLVNNPRALSYAQILALPSTTQTVRIYCPDVIDDTDEWTGVPLSALLNAAGLLPEAGEVALTGADGYYIILPLETVLSNGVFLAYQMDGQALSQDRGYPLRLVVSGSDGGDWLRWVTNIEVRKSPLFFSNYSSIIQKLSGNIPVNGSKLCACFLPTTVVNYQVVEDIESKSDRSDSL